MSAIEKIKPSRRSSFRYKTAPAMVTLSAPYKKINLEPIINHCSSIMKTINELEPVKQAFLTQEVLASLREIQFFQENLTNQKALQHFDNLKRL